MAVSAPRGPGQDASRVLKVDSRLDELDSVVQTVRRNPGQF
jgi:hypothetical protein